MTSQSDPELHARRSWLAGATWLLAGTVLNGVLSAAVGVALVRVFGASNLGLYSVATASVAIAAVFSTLRMETHLLTVLDRSDADELRYVQAVRSAYLLYVPLATIVAAGSFVALNGSARAVALLAVVEVGIAPLQFARVVLQVSMQQRSVFLALAAGRIFWAAGVALLAVTGHATVVTVIATRISATVIESILLHRSARLSWLSIVRTPVPVRDQLGIIRRCIPFAAAGLTGEAYGRLDQPLLAALNGNREVGLYAAGVRVAELTGVHSPIIQAVITPSLVDLHRRGDRSGFAHGVRDGMLLTLIPGGFAVALAISQSDRIAVSLFGDAFARSGQMIALLAVAEWLTFVGTAYGNALIAEGKRVILVPLNVAGLGLNVGVNLMFAPEFGGVATSYASIAAYGLVAVMLMLGSSALRREAGSGLGVIFRASLVTAVAAAAPIGLRVGVGFEVLLTVAIQCAGTALLFARDSRRLMVFVREATRVSR